MDLRKVFAAIVFVVLCVVLLFMVRVEIAFPVGFKTYAPLPQLSNFGGYTPLPEECGGVLKSASNGHWVQRPMTDKEVKDMDTYIRDAAGQHGVPRSLEAEDGRCGTVTYPTSPMLRALCNPTGNRPCCLETRCVDLPVENCTCPKCFDLRTQIYAEHSTWVTSDPWCQFRNFSMLEACQVARDTVLTFVGDSYMRHLYTAAMILLSGNPYDGALKAGSSKEIRKECQGMYMFTEKRCRLHIKEETSFCNNTVFPRLQEWWGVSFGPRLEGLVRSILHRPNHFVFVNIGLHENNNIPRVFNFARLFLDVLNSTQAVWPKLVWIGIHANGLLKTPYAHHRNQHNEGIYNFNQGLKEKFRPYGLPMLDAFNLSLGVSSFDGSHQGLGVSLLKMQVLLNYIAEVRTRI